MPSPRKPRIRARLAGPTGLAAALALGIAGPASASVHRAAVSGPGPGWAPAAATPTDSPLSAMAVLGACGLAGFLLLVLGRRKTPDEPPSAAPPPPIDLEAMMLSGRERRGRRPGGPSGPGAQGYPIASTTGGDGGAAPNWVRRLNDQAPPPEPARPVEGAYRG
jgi:hypothetical protein